MGLRLTPGTDTRDQEGEQDKGGGAREMNYLAKGESRESVVHLRTDQGNEHFDSVLSPIPDH